MKTLFVFSLAAFVIFQSGSLYGSSAQSTKKMQIQNTKQSRWQQRYHPHGTASPETLDVGSIGIEQTPGQHNIEAFSLTSAINVGILPRLQIGTSPLFWGLPNSFNINSKLNFYKSKSWSFGASVFYLHSKNEVDELNHYALSLNSGYRINSFSQVTYSLGVEKSDFFFGAGQTPQHFFDYQRSINRFIDVTTGASWADNTLHLMKNGNYKPSLGSTLGIGASVTLVGLKKWLWIYPSIGFHYYPRDSSASWLISIYSR